MGNTDSCCKTRTQSVTRIKQDRGCTDVLFLLLLAACTAVMVFLTSDAVANGADPNEILRRVDMNGSICGVDLPDEPYAAWPNPSNWDAVVCLSDCSETNNPSNDKMARLYTSSKFVTLCVPTMNGNSSGLSMDSFFSAFGSPMQVATRSVATVNEVVKPIMYSAIGALVLSFLVTFVLQKTAKCFIWGCILLIITGGLWLGFVMHGWATDTQETLGDSNRATATLYGSYVVWAASGIFILLVFAMRTQINISIEVVEEAGRAINDMKSIVFFPVIPFFLSAGYFLVWLIMGLNLMSVTGSVREPAPDSVLYRGPEFGLRAGTRIEANPAEMVVQTREDKWMYAGYFHIFMLLWTFQILFYYGYHVFAGATADWYFSPGADTGHRRVGTAPLFRSALRALRYHMGTVAVCGLIIAIIKTVRAVVVYLEKKTKGKPPNGLQRAVFCALHCCLKCVECCMDKVNKNALIWQAVYGDSFGTACCSSFALVWRNLARVAALHIVSWLIIDLGKVAVALLTTGLFSYLIQSSYEAEISELGLPIFLVFCISLSVASMFFMIFQSVIDTTFFCFLIDCEANAGTGQMMASPGLKALVQDYKDESKQEATSHQDKRIRRGAAESDTKFLGVVEMTD